MLRINLNSKGLLHQAPNLISLLRIALACVFFALLPKLFQDNSGFEIALAVFGAICVTDLVDGKLANGQ